MTKTSSHLTRTFVAGIVALLPVGGTVLSIVLAEDAISESWLADQHYYFPGLGLVIVAGLIYLVGLTITTFIGRLFWKLLDGLIEELPALGTLYRTLKQVLGYGEGKDAMFERAVLVPGRDPECMEIGLVTRSQESADGGEAQLVVFVPAAPTPTSGRVVVIAESKTRPLDLSVHDALKFLVAVGKLEIEVSPTAA